MDKSEERSIKKNSFFSFLTTSLRVIANFFLFLTIARFYGPEVFGQFTYAFTTITIFLYISDFGIDILLATELPKNRSIIDSIFNELFSIKIIFIVFSFSLLLVYIIIVDIGKVTSGLLIILSFYLITSSLLNYFFAFFKGIERLEIETKVTFIYNLCVIVLIALLYFFNFKIIYIALSLVVFRIFSLAIAYYDLLRFISSIKIKFDFSLINKYRNKVSIFGLHYIFNYLYYNIDTLLLAYILNERAVGIFQAAFKLLVILLIIPEIINNALLPALSRLNNENKLAWEKYSYLFNKFLMIIIFPAAIIIYLNSKDIINFVYDNDFNKSAEILKYYVLIIAIRFLIEPLGLLLTTANKQNLRAYTVFIVTIVSIVMNIIFIHKYGVLGLVWTGFITNLLILITYIFFNYNICKNWYVNKTTLSFFVSIIILALLLAYIKSLLIQFIIAIIYIFVYGYFIFLNREERILINPLKYKIKTK
ncbi:flippase [Melioribacter sp. OK-6-Me]|uniref:flippase n=1 Tax=unclassified Melioribacter TaxID=2627329 RepID=UPI003ED87074